MTICCRRNFKKGSFNWKLKGPFLIVKSDWSVTSPSPLTPINFQNISYQNFEITILFNVFGRSGKLQEKIDKVPGRNMMLLLGDFNAQVDRNRDRWYPSLGKFYL
jgi:hypothetical protein